MLMCLVVPCLLQAEEVGNEPALLIRKTPDAYLVKRDYDDINEVDLLANTDVNLFEEFTIFMSIEVDEIFEGIAAELPAKESVATSSPMLLPEEIADVILSYDDGGLE